MIVSLGDCDNCKTTEIVGKRLKGLIKRAIKEGKYNSQKEFFERVQERINDTSIDLTNSNTYNKYLNGGTNMKLDVLKQICIELKCSANYLMGITPFNSDYSGAILRLLGDIDSNITYSWDPIESNVININYYGTTLSYKENELAEKLKDLISASLFVDSKKI